MLVRVLTEEYQGVGIVSGMMMGVQPLPVRPGIFAGRGSFLILLTEG